MIRKANFAGSWYPDSGLDEILSEMLPDDHKLKIKAVIAPHAGYTYSGKTLGSIYCKIDSKDIDQVFLIGVIPILI
jgi:AmmeMemoRadiSam system protein B